jgi:hypothetical protein
MPGEVKYRFANIPLRLQQEPYREYMDSIWTELVSIWAREPEGLLSRGLLDLLELWRHDARFACSLDVVFFWMEYFWKLWFLAGVFGRGMDCCSFFWTCCRDDFWIGTQHRMKRNTYTDLHLFIEPQPVAQAAPERDQASQGQQAPFAPWC